jgi:hypothetical protein
LEISLSLLTLKEFRSLMVTIPEQIRKGKPLAQSMRETHVFPSILVQMVAAGEKTATMDATMADVATFYEQEVEEEVKGLTQIIEPVMMLMVGVAVMIEHTTKNVFIYEDGVTTHIGHGMPKITNFTERKRVGFYDLYFVQSWDFGKALIKTMKVRETGSQAGNLLMFLVGISQFCGGPRVAPEEIGTVYALVKGAGGKVTTQTGEDAGALIFGTTSNDRYNIVAGNEKAVDAIAQCFRTQQA